MASSDPPSLHQDIEKNDSDYAHLTNTSVHSLSFEGITVTVKDRVTKQPKTILSDVNGVVKAGELMALMGPSGSGKTTLLNVLARREASASANVKKTLHVNGQSVSLNDFRRISCYVEQDDALIGALTVNETMHFAARLSLPSNISKTDRKQRIEALLSAFGLQRQSSNLIGTPIRKGISGGQKRRLSVASQLITSPKIIFLDEPTSGLDSQASFEVISFVKNIAKKYRLLVIASIHQPSTNTFTLFDKLLLLSEGRTAYNGTLPGVRQYFAQTGHEMPHYMNPAEFIIELVSTDFARERHEADRKIQDIHNSWAISDGATSVLHEIEKGSNEENGITGSDGEARGRPNPLLIPLVLVHRSFIKSYRDVVAYGIRIAMYIGLAIMMGTVWLRLGTDQQNINSFTNAIFFGGAFMSFMAVAYIPSYLEDRSMYLKERANGLYGPSAFMLANFIIGVPFLFLITILFSVIAYWLSNFRPNASAFWMWILWLFLDLLAAESLVILITNLVPIFVVALAAVAFANGLWMSANGFMVPPRTLNVFYRYVFHYIDYQAYVFQGMMVNEFKDRTYDCEQLPQGGCNCMYVSDLQSECKINGMAVLESYGYNIHRTGLWVGIMVGIIVGYRLLGWLVLYVKKH